jgi:hypothetical protein
MLRDASIPAGSNDIVPEQGFLSLQGFITAMTLTNVDQTTPIDTTNTDGGGGSVSLSWCLTISASDVRVYWGATWNSFTNATPSGADLLSPVSSGTELFDVPSTGTDPESSVHGGAIDFTGGPGQQEVGFHWSLTGGFCAQTVFGVLEAAAGGGGHGIHGLMQMGIGRAPLRDIIRW